MLLRSKECKKLINYCFLFNDLRLLILILNLLYKVILTKRTFFLTKYNFKVN